MANKEKPQECTNKRQALSQLRRKKWNEDIKFRTKAQADLHKTMDTHTITFCAGPAGTGNSFISLYYARTFINSIKTYSIVISTAFCTV